MAEIFDFGLQQHKIKMDGKFFESNLFAVAGDTGRRLEVQLLDTNNMVQDTTGISLRLNANVAGQATYAEATLVDATKGLYELDLPNGMLLAPGNWQFQWQIIGATGEKLHSFAFTGSVGSNLSEGGSEATNFYLNADELKKMQDDLINGTFNSEVLETNIAEKLTILEEQYAPKLTEVTAQLAQTEMEVRNNIAKKHVISINRSLESFKNSSRAYNLSKFNDINNAWFTKNNLTIGNEIVINGILLQKVISTNFYDNLRIKNASGLGLVDGKKYLISGYCLNLDSPRFFYSKSSASGIDYAFYADNQLRRFWYIKDGSGDAILYTQGESGLNVEGSSYVNNIYIGGVQVEEIDVGNTKTGIIFIGDSTVDGSSGKNDNMKQAEWAKTASSLLNANHYNRGIGGNRTQEMIDRWNTDITPLAYKCKYVVIQGGINDLSKPDTSEELIKKNLQTMFDLAIVDNLIPVMCTITPCNKTGLDEDIRLAVNAWIKSNFDNVLDIAAIVTDPIESNKILQLDGWQGDGVHYGQLAKNAVANYVASQGFWNLLKPSVYQKLNNNLQDNQSLSSGTTYFDKNGNKRLEIKEFGTGTDIVIYDGDASSYIRQYGNELYITNLNKQIIINSGTQNTTLKSKTVVEKEFSIPSIAPTTLGNGQLWFESGVLKVSVSGVAKNVTIQ